MFHQNLQSFYTKCRENPPLFNYSPAMPVSNLLVQSFGLLGSHLTNSVPSGDLQTVAENIKSYQNNQTGHFVDQTIIDCLSGKTHDLEYVSWQMTDFALLALGDIEESPLHPFHFMEDFENDSQLLKWIENLRWTDPWYASNMVMFLTNILLFQEQDTKKSDSRAHLVLDWLDHHQDKQTGLWNMGNNVSLVNQMAAGFHFFFFYTYLGRPIQYWPQIIDSTLAIQDVDGLFNYAGGGGSCEDLDAIDILGRALLYTDYRQKDVHVSLGKAHHALVGYQNPDGGYCWAKRDYLSPVKLLSTILPKTSLKETKHNICAKLMNQYNVLFHPKSFSWSYSGIEEMHLPLSQSELWSTWFRTLALAIIEVSLKKNPSECSCPWVMRKKPGLGFYS